MKIIGVEKDRERARKFSENPAAFTAKKKESSGLERELFDQECLLL